MNKKVCHSLWTHTCMDVYTHTHMVIKYTCLCSPSPSPLYSVCSVVSSALRSPREPGMSHCSQHWTDQQGQRGWRVHPGRREGLEGSTGWAQKAGGPRNQSFSQRHPGLNFDPEREALKAKQSPLPSAEVCIAV